LVLLTAFLVWRSASLGIAEYHLAEAQEGDADAVDSAAVWRPHHPEVLYRRARAMREEDDAAATALLEESVAANPAAANPLLVLADIARSAEELDQADALIRQASSLRPANPSVHYRIGGYWAGRGDLKAAVAHWSKALEASQAYSWKRLYPVMLALAEEPRTIGLFKPIATSPPTWWERFFGETAQRAIELETVRTLYAFRRSEGEVPLTRAEREHYIRRLQRDGKITEAYLVWVNGLDAEERRYLGVINNGGFEIEPTNAGFGWHLSRTSQVDASTARTSGVVGERALHLVFKRRQGYFSHVHQPLFLDPVTYRVSGMVRTDSLDSKGGLKWVVRCLLPEPDQLGESERFLGSSEWREFSFTVQVPADCTAQEIRLVSAGKRRFEYKMTGGIWFDNLAMRKVLTQTAAASVGTTGGTMGSTGAAATGSGDFDPLSVTGGRAFRLDESLLEGLAAPEAENDL
jgi:tetratricopeptide (TPR) repeat protein